MARLWRDSGVGVCGRRRGRGIFVTATVLLLLMLSSLAMIGPHQMALADWQSMRKTPAISLE